MLSGKIRYRINLAKNNSGGTTLKNFSYPQLPRAGFEKNSKINKVIHRRFLLIPPLAEHPKSEIK